MYNILYYTLKEKQIGNCILLQFPIHSFTCYDWLFSFLNSFYAIALMVCKLHPAKTCHLPISHIRKLGENRPLKEKTDDHKDATDEDKQICKVEYNFSNEF